MREILLLFSSFDSAPLRRRMTCPIRFVTSPRSLTFYSNIIWKNPSTSIKLSSLTFPIVSWPLSHSTELGGQAGWTIEGKREAGEPGWVRWSRGQSCAQTCQTYCVAQQAHPGEQPPPFDKSRR